MIGTANILEAIRTVDSVHAAIIVTTDKCYENQGSENAYHESDRLGGMDPYSSSKACAELLTSAYRASYFSSQQVVRLATGRAGNVIGGGDWALNRLIPDCIRAYMEKKPLTLRYPEAIRPWQHVLESIHGYITLAEHLTKESGQQYAEAWNFGPTLDDMETVGIIASKMSQLLNISIDHSPITHRHESALLRLDSSKAHSRLGWRSRWSLSKSLEETVNWYREWLNKKDMLEFSHRQIEHYINE